MHEDIPSWLCTRAYKGGKKIKQYLPLNITPPPQGSRSPSKILGMPLDQVAYVLTPNTQTVRPSQNHSQQSHASIICPSAEHRVPIHCTVYLRVGEHDRAHAYSWRLGEGTRRRGHAAHVVVTALDTQKLRIWGICKRSCLSWKSILIPLL